MPARNSCRAAIARREPSVALKRKSFASTPEARKPLQATASHCKPLQVQAAFELRRSALQSSYSAVARSGSGDSGPLGTACKSSGVLAEQDRATAAAAKLCKAPSLGPLGRKRALGPPPTCPACSRPSRQTSTGFSTRHREEAPLKKGGETSTNPQHRWMSGSCPTEWAEDPRPLRKVAMFLWALRATTPTPSLPLRTRRWPGPLLGQPGRFSGNGFFFIVLKSRPAMQRLHKDRRRAERSPT